MSGVAMERALICSRLGSSNLRTCSGERASERASSFRLSIGSLLAVAGLQISQSIVVVVVAVAASCYCIRARADGCNVGSDERCAQQSALK